MTTPTAARLPQSIRSRFPVFERLTYLNSCSQGALSDVVRGAYDDYLSGLETTGSDWDAWVGKQEELRDLLAALLNTARGNVAVTTSASAGLSAIASALDFSGSRNRVVTTDLDFPTSAQIWHAQARRGAEIHTVRAGSSAVLDLEELAAAVDERTAIVTVPHVCYRNGAHVDLAAVIEIAHQRGARVVVDAYQSVGARPLDMQALKPDFLVGGMLKYLLSSPGAAFLYADPETTADLVPTVTGWFAARDIFAMSIEGFDPAADARRFEAGTPAVPSLFAGAAGLALMLEIGVESTAAHVAGLCTQLREGVAEIGGTVATPATAAGPMIAVRSTNAPALVAALANEGIIVSDRDGNVRVSPHCYNSAEDIDHALRVLTAQKGLLV
ncbi:aminotransferase class V-fold PLP-dependent enzyme [Ornithinimicrobium faecis]|uniref:aminotransferase class V-fold PLP-dependent enzyme n=1 Tax=Ornithinimicrobium faecis TaxID=2934158 RepID=UPI002118C270|nr:aminotransferase class V-fold PLP-dependent enzyme [Ornithinimicrobium sp. HY1745]